MVGKERSYNGKKGLFLVHQYLKSVGIGYINIKLEGNLINAFFKIVVVI